MTVSRRRARGFETKAMISRSVLHCENPFDDRPLAMVQNLLSATELSLSSLELYRQGSIIALNLLRSFRRQVHTANNFLDV